MKGSLIQAGCNDLAIHFTFLCHRQDPAGLDWGSYPLSDQYELFPPLPNISFLYRDQLGEISLQKLPGQRECRCLHWPNSTAPCWICPEHYPACWWSPDTTGTLLTLPVLAQRRRPPGHLPGLLQILLVLAWCIIAFISLVWQKNSNEGFLK